MVHIKNKSNFENETDVPEKLSHRQMNHSTTLRVHVLKKERFVNENKIICIKFNLFLRVRTC